MPGLDDLIRTKDEFDQLGLEFLVVMAFPASNAKATVDYMELPYPVYADPDAELFRAVQTGFIIAALPAWVVVDAEGTIRFLWRIDSAQGLFRYAEADDILAEARKFLTT